jgi:hypothetical protein
VLFLCACVKIIKATKVLISLVFCVCRFIGELFKLKMLTENIMHDCVFKLLRTKDPENLECLCRLLTTIGKELDVDKAKVCNNVSSSHSITCMNKPKLFPFAINIEPGQPVHQCSLTRVLLDWWINFWTFDTQISY